MEPVVLYEGKPMMYNGKVVTGGVIAPTVPELYYFGLIEGKTRPGENTLDMSLLTLVNMGSNVDQLEIIYPKVTGWLVMAEPVQCPLRARWYVDAFNQGFIGGPFTGRDPNLFPTPGVRSYNGTLRIYISSYRTKLSKSLSFLKS